MFLAFVLVLTLGLGQDYAHTAKNPAKASSPSQTSLVPLYQGLEAVDFWTVVQDPNYTEFPSFPGREVPCPCPRQDDFQGSMAMQVVPAPAPQQTQSTLLWGMWIEVATMHRLHLCAQCPKIGVSALPALPGCISSFMDVAGRSWRLHSSRWTTSQLQCTTPAAKENQRSESWKRKRRRQEQRQREDKGCTSPTAWTSSTTCTSSTTLDGSTASHAIATCYGTTTEYTSGTTTEDFGGPAEKESGPASSRIAIDGARSSGRGWPHFHKGHALCCDAIWKGSQGVQFIHQGPHHALSVLAAISGRFHRTMEDIYVKLRGTDQAHLGKNCGCQKSHERGRAGLGSDQGEHCGASGIRVRDGCGSCRQSWRADSRGIVWHGQHLGRAQQDSRGHCHTGLGTSCQESQKGPRQRRQGRGFQQTWICLYAAFWSGPLSATEVCLNAAHEASSTWLHDPTLKWRHTVCSHSDFVSEWEACRLASCLAAELDHWDLPQNLVKGSISSCTTKPSRGAKSHVRFAQEIEVLIGIDGQLKMSTLNVPEQVLHHWTGKPWALHLKKNAAMPLRVDAETDDDTTSFMQSNWIWTQQEGEALQHALQSALQSGGLEDCPAMVQQMIANPTSSSSSTREEPRVTELPEALRNL